MQIKILLLSLMLFAGSALAQTYVKGRVSTANGEPLAGVHVLIHQSKSGTVTREDGTYQIALPAQLKVFSVEFTVVGYKPRLENVLLPPSGEDYTLDVTLAETPLELQEVTVTAGIIKEQEQIAYPIATVMKKDVVSNGDVNLSQAIARTPGVYFSSLGNAVGKPVVRGLTNANLILLNNGIKLENFNFSSNHPFLVDEFTASHIEVIKGPASLQYGSDAVGGVINVVRERPAQAGSLEGDLISHYNTNTNGYMTSLSTKAATKRLFFGVRGTVKSHEDFKDGNNQVVGNTRFNEQHLNAQAGLRTGFGIFSLTYNYTKARYGLQNQNQISLFANSAAKPFLAEGRENQVWYQNLDNHLLTLNNTLFLGKKTLDVDVAYQTNRRQGIGGAYNAQQRQLLIPTFASMQLNTLTYHAKLTLPAEKRKLLLGINGANIRNDADETKPNNPLPDSRINDLGIYAIADVTLNEKLTATGGLRYDYRRMESFPTHTQTTNQYKIDNTYNNLNGSVGITYRLSETQLLKANAARGFRSPTMPELTQNGIHAARFERGNPDMKAQSNYQLDVTYHLHNRWMALNVSPFYNVINNYIYLVQTSQPAPVGGGRIFQHVQNEAVFAGGEVALDFHPLRWLGIHGSYSFVRAEIKNDTEGFKHPTFTPQDRLTGKIKVEQEKVGFFKRPYAALEVWHFFEQNRTGQNEAVTPAYTLLNFRVGTSIAVAGQVMDLFINGNNLANTAYIDHLSVTKQLNLNMIGRNIVFGLRLPFGLARK